MKRKLFQMIVLAGVAAASSVVAADDSAVQAIRSAPDPSSTIQAYAHALAAGGEDSAVEKAYVARMVDLGAPELADAQAHNLIKVGAADALVAGAAAYNDAARGNAHAAIENLKLALIYSPRDSFLLRTAGQAVAWYDSQAGQTHLASEDAAGIEWLRTAGIGSQEFIETYKLAMQARQAQPRAEQANVDSTTGAQSTGTRTSSSAERSSNQSSGETSTSYSYYYYPNSSSGSSYSGSYYPYSAYGYYGSASIIALRDGAFNRDVAALQRSGAGEILRGAGGDLRSIGGPGAARALAGRPPQAPAGLPKGPSGLPQAPPRMPTPPRLPGPPPGPPHP